MRSSRNFWPSLPSRYIHNSLKRAVFKSPHRFATAPLYNTCPFRPMRGLQEGEPVEVSAEETC